MKRTFAFVVSITVNDSEADKITAKEAMHSTRYALDTGWLWERPVAAGRSYYVSPSKVSVRHIKEAP